MNCGRTLLVSSLVFVQVITIIGMESGFTFVLNARKKDCFYETLKVNMSLDLEYQVIDGGDLDINFEIIDPNGEQLVYKEKSSDESHELTVEVAGVYSFCLDNSFSSMTSKVVYLDLGIVRDEEHSEKDAAIDAVYNVYDNLESIRSRLEKMSSYQGAMRAREARQRYFLESNNSRVVWVSSVASIIMISVGLVHVYFVRRLFDDRSKTRI